MSRTAFLDRDGTLNAEVDYLGDPRDLRVLPGVPAALRQLHDAGYRIVVVTNQSGIARGRFGEADLARIHAALHAALGELPLAYLHCPHLPEGSHGYGGDCPCRKPKPGLLHQARELLGVDFAGGVLVGDSARDLLMGRGLPLRTVLVHSGKDQATQRATLRDAGMAPDHEAADLAAAVAWLLADDRRSR